MVLIYPTQPQLEPHQELQSQCQFQAAPLVYDIVVSEQLLCFDPSITIRHLFMSYENALKLNHLCITVKPVLVYLLGLLLRIIVIFLLPYTSKIFAVLSVVFQFPTVFLGILSFRYEYAKVLVRTFEFCFLTSTAMLWVICAFIFVQDLRVVLLPIVWVDFINLVLVETYFGDSKTMFVINVVFSIDCSRTQSVALVPMKRSLHCRLHA